MADTNKMATVNDKGRTSCCNAMSTFAYDGVECCKACWEEVASSGTVYDWSPEENE